MRLHPLSRLANHVRPATTPRAELAAAIERTPVPYVRGEVLAGILDQTRREVLDGLHTLAYFAEREGDAVRAARIYTMVGELDPEPFRPVEDHEW
jgi:hypothetical protein